MTDVHHLTATEMVAGFADRSLSPVEAAEACLARIDELKAETANLADEQKDTLEPHVDQVETDLTTLDSADSLAELSTGLDTTRQHGCSPKRSLGLAARRYGSFCKNSAAGPPRTCGMVNCEWFGKGPGQSLGRVAPVPASGSGPPAKSAQSPRSSPAC